MQRRRDIRVQVDVQVSVMGASDEEVVDLLEGHMRQFPGSDRVRVQYAIAWK